MDIEVAFEQFRKINVLILGDVMIDRYLNGQVDRISPEAPVPVIRLQEEDNRLGGAANVALNIASLGATPYLFSVVGKDSNGQLLKELLPKSNISSKYLHTSDTRQTTVKTRVIAQNQHLLRVDREDKHPLSSAEEKEVLTAIRKLLDQKTIQVILFQDYNKGVLTSRLIREVTLEAIRRDIITVVDPKSHNFWAYKKVTLFKPNLREMQEQMNDRPLRPVLEDLNRAAISVQEKLGNRYTIITLSEKGLFLYDGKNGQIIPTTPRSIADVCGAGDTVISTVAAGLALGLALEETAFLANLAGGQVCEKVGVVPVDRRQLQEEYFRIRAEQSNSAR